MKNLFQNWPFLVVCKRLEVARKKGFRWFSHAYFEMSVHNNNIFSLFFRIDSVILDDSIDYNNFRLKFNSTSFLFGKYMKKY